MATQPKEYLVFVGARIEDIDYVRLKKLADTNKVSIADCVRSCIREGVSNVEITEDDNAELDSVRCHIHEQRKRYALKK